MRISDFSRSVLFCGFAALMAAAPARAEEPAEAAAETPAEAASPWE